MSGVRAKEPAIGVFDSGVGGLTVFRRIAEALPCEHLCYLGDTARVPYGTKSADTVIRYARSCAAHLQARGIKMLVVACNTASAYALDVLRDELPVPVVGVIEPGARAAVARTRTGRVGVIGTPGTVASGAYRRAIAALSPDIRVYSQACPLFVSLVEDGWTTGPVPEAVAGRYLSTLTVKGVDTLVLGCTHYPLLRGVIAKVMGPQVRLVDSAKETAKAVAETLHDRRMLRTAGRPGRREFCASDAPENFARVGARMLGARTPLARVEWVDV